MHKRLHDRVISSVLVGIQREVALAAAVKRAVPVRSDYPILSNIV